MSTKFLRWIGPALVTVMLSGPAMAAAGLPESPVPITAPAPAAAQKATPTKAAPATKAATTKAGTNYAQREQQSQGLEKFKGGEGAGIYISGSVLAIALLVVLLVVLL
jgi:hypothetical protein